MKGAYYVLVVPDEWGAFLTFSKTVSFAALGLNGDGKTHVCSRVLAMGSASAVPLFQHIHRRTGLSEGLSPAMELRRDRRLPMKFEDRSGSWTQFFLDDADSPCLVTSERLAESLGVPSKLQKAQRRAAESKGLSYSADEAVEGELQVERMGAWVDGFEGRISAPEKVLLSTLMFGFWVLSLQWILWRTWLMLLGQINRVFKFRRPLFSGQRCSMVFRGMRRWQCALLGCKIGDLDGTLRYPIWFHRPSFSYSP